MNLQLTITKQGDCYVCCPDVPDAHQVGGSTPLQATRRWLYWVGAMIQKCHAGEITIEELADRIGISYYDAIELVEVEDLLPKTVVASNNSESWN